MKTSLRVPIEAVGLPCRKHKERQARHALPLQGVVCLEISQVSHNDCFAACKLLVPPSRDALRRTGPLGIRGCGVRRAIRYGAEDFFDYVKNEKALSEEYPEIFKRLLAKYPTEITTIRKSPHLTERGSNTITILKKKLKAFSEASPTLAGLVFCNKKPPL